MGDDDHHNIKIGAKDGLECPVHGQILQNFYKTVKERFARSFVSAMGMIGIYFLTRVFMRSSSILSLMLMASRMASNPLLALIMSVNSRARSTSEAVGSS